MLALGGSVRVAPYATFGTPELAALVVDALEGKTAALMANHGALVHGADMSRPRWSSPACSSGPAPSTGGRPRWAPRARSTDQELEAVLAAVMERGYGAVRGAAPEGPPA